VPTLFESKKLPLMLIDLIAIINFKPFVIVTYATNATPLTVVECDFAVVADALVKVFGSHSRQLASVDVSELQAAAGKCMRCSNIQQQCSSAATMPATCTHHTPQ
jgi:hypothetical protein